MQLLKYRKTSELDLKFLDAKFRSVQPSLGQTTPISKMSCHENKNKKSLDHSIAKNKKIFSKSIQLTNDVTQDITLLNNQAQKRYQYNPTSTQYIFQSIKANKINKYQNKQHQISIDNEFEKYKRQIRSLQKENKQIHQQIKRIYFTNKQPGKQLTKNVKNMRVLQKLVDSGSFNQQIQLIDANNQSISCIQWTFLRPRVPIKDIKKKESITTHLPTLQQSKYQNIYQNLYKQRKKRSKLLKQGKRLKKSQKQIISKSNETFQQLKTKILNNNIDKNFQTFFSQQNIRVPQILKNLR